MDNGLYTVMVMIDLQKAFDTVNHSLLSDKLHALGLNDISFSWFDSYLTNRTQKVDIIGTFSKPRMVPCGVPQGSILGPLLFLIYVNDMEFAVKCKLIVLTLSPLNYNVIECLSAELIIFLIKSRNY